MNTVIVFGLRFIGKQTQNKTGHGPDIMLLHMKVLDLVPRDMSAVASEVAYRSEGERLLPLVLFAGGI